jgi:hypothetical protein
MPENMYDTYGKKEEKPSQRYVINHSKQQHSTHHQRQNPNYKRGSQKATPPIIKQCTRIVVAQSKILDFHPGESLGS